MLVSFLSVVVLLFFAGLVSLFELRRVSSDTEEILRASERNLGLAKDMLDAAARQNKAVVHSIVFRHEDLRDVKAVSRLKHPEKRMPERGVLLSARTIDRPECVRRERPLSLHEKPFLPPSGWDGPVSFALPPPLSS